ncbi:sterol desaturase/sphingolipid hydroxylase (fatty acid hydroxylase superfamily) [Prosthecobacter fusiformis]|uniref:Sterol desaturase/sphingolipid hydroxylase (Fatty acid hydroxylase superfamily) n=1 Tax=Prosthecobacter fusiformis TaxID=48464 RepID=A0A4R7SQ05_9BACT|nr:sterol desaturase family protein [Prosthecobacter fusiformis]TDU80705.1 sterol desaturase/sphingolipid hydroxylase (fatty acid hydroxylase superfamily) [Prosthecobacter fusiformis]
MSTSLQNILFGLLFLTVLFLVIERGLGRARGPLLRRGWLTDVGYFFFTPFVTRVLSKAGLILPAALLVWCGVASVEDFRQQSYAGFGPVSRQPLWLQGVQIYLLADLLGYWSHRLFHGGRWWAFHAVHHSSEDLDWLSSIRVHPVNDLVNKFIQVTPLLLLGFNPWVTLSTAPFFTLYAIFLHARVDWDFGPFRYVISTPVFHRWHHSRQREAWDKNFAGLFPVWDLIFGTFYMPRGRVPEDFGITEDFPQHLPGQLWEPVRRLWVRKSGSVDP